MPYTYKSYIKYAVVLYTNKTYLKGIAVPYTNKSESIGVPYTIKTYPKLLQININILMK